MTAYCIGTLFHPLPLIQRLGRRCGLLNLIHTTARTLKNHQCSREFFLDDDRMYPAHAIYGDGTEIEPEAIQHIRAVNWSCAVGFQWWTGDIAVLDNLAVMHSRLSFKGKRRILSFLNSC